MRIQAEPLNGYEPFSMPGSNSRAVAREVQDVAVIDLVGPLVVEVHGHALCDRIQELLDEGAKDLAVDLADVPYADSSGLCGLAGAYNLTRQAAGRIKFFAASEQLVGTLKRLHLDTVFELFEDEASALSSFH